MASNVNVGIKFKADAGNVPSVVDGIQSKVQSLNGDSLESVTRRAADLGQVGELVTAKINGLASTLSGAATNALTTAATFEQLRAKLVSVTGSMDAANAKFKFATDFAATTPFDVKGIVGATALLEGFGQKAEEVLPAAANLAAALGTSLDDATRVIGKAASGSLEGFQSLRDVYALTTNDLKKFGLQVDTTGSILSKTPEQIEKNRAALLRLIQVRYGDAIVRQSETLNGALSNLADTGEQLAASFGESLIPIATAAARAVTGFLGIVNSIPNGAKAAIAGIVAIGAGVAILGAGIAATVTGLIVLQAQTLALGATLIQGSVAASVLATTSGVLGTALGFVTNAAGLAVTALRGIATANPLLLGTLAIVTALSFAASDYERKQRAAGDAVTAAGNKFAQANTTLKQTIATLNTAGREVGVAVEIVSKSRDQFGELQDAFSKLSPEQIVTAFSKAGETTESLKDKLKALENGAGTVQEKLKLLAQAQTQIDAQDFDAFAKTQQELAALGIQVSDSADGMNTLKSQTAALTLEMNRIGQARLALTGVISAFQQFATPLEKATADSKALGSFLDLSKQVGTTHALAQGLEAVNAQIKANAATAGIGSDNIDKLLDKLRDPAASELQKNAIREQIGLIQQATSIKQKQADAEDKAIKQILDAEENAFALRKAGNDVQLTEELAHVQKMLGIARAGSDEATALARREAELKKGIREKERQTAEASLSSQIGAAKQLVADAKSGVGDASILKVLDDAKGKVDAWAAANKGLISTYPKLKQELDKFASDNALEVKREQARLARETLQNLTSELGVFISEANTNAGKLAATEGAINVLTRARSLHLTNEVDTQQAINQLTRQKLQLEKAVADEKRAQQDQLKDLEQQNLENSIGVLEQRKAAGEKVDNELKKARENVVKGRLQDIEREKEAEIAKSGDAANAEAQAALKRDSILQAETVRRFQELQKQTQDHDAALTAQEKRHGQHVSRLQGPIRTIEQAFGGSSSFNLGSFELGGFNLDSTRVPRAPDFNKERSKVDAQFGGKKGSAGAGAGAGASQPGAAASGQVVNDNRQVVVNGQDLYGPEFSKRVLEIFKLAKQDSRVR